MALPGHRASCTALSNEERCWCEAKHYAEMLAISAFILVVELVAGYFSNSLALFADAGHVAGDNLSLIINLITAVLVARGTRRGKVRPCAFRAGLILLVAVIMWVIAEAITRFGDPHNVNSVYMIAAALICAPLTVVQMRSHGLVADEHKDDAHDVQHRHFFKDFLIHCSVIVGGVLVLTTGLAWFDSILSIFIGLFVLGDLALHYMVRHGSKKSTEHRGHNHSGHPHSH